jgi:hypothetical protein
VPLEVVTASTGQGNITFHYVAAVWPEGQKWSFSPWASVNLMPNNSNYSRLWSMPAEGWKLRYTQGTFVAGITTQNLNQPGASLPAALVPPAVNAVVAINWQASIAYQALLGNNAFYDVPWYTLFVQSQGTTPLRVTVTAVPSALPGGLPFAASILGTPIATPNGNLFTTLRIVRLIEPHLIPLGVYVFAFKVIDQNNLSSVVTLNITIT